MSDTVKVVCDEPHNAEYRPVFCSRCGLPPEGPPGSYEATLAPGEWERLVRDAVERMTPDEIEARLGTLDAQIDLLYVNEEFASMQDQRSHERLGAFVRRAVLAALLPASLEERHDG